MTQEINKAFHEAAGKCWKEDNIIEDDNGNVQYYPNPNYCDDPRLVIEVMRERKDWDEFAEEYLIKYYEKRTHGYAIPIDLIMDSTGKLTKLAMEWLNQRKGKSDEV